MAIYRFSCSASGPKGWSQEELGDRAGMHRTYISQVERVIKTPSIVAVDRIALALGASIGELLD